MKLFKRFIVFTIRFVSRLFRWNNLRACRFTPSCSEYSIQAFQCFGIFNALWLMVKRISRCHPFAQGGFDPLRK